MVSEYIMSESVVVSAHAEIFYSLSKFHTCILSNCCTLSIVMSNKSHMIFVIKCYLHILVYTAYVLVCF